MTPLGERFVFVVDPDPTPTERAAWDKLPTQLVEEHLVNVRLAHELAHVLFYGLDGHRLTSASQEEEAFCDAFADTLFPSP